MLTSPPDEKVENEMSLADELFKENIVMKEKAVSEKGRPAKKSRLGEA